MDGLWGTADKGRQHLPHMRNVRIANIIKQITVNMIVENLHEHRWEQALSRLSRDEA
jgi:hypothetical protein